MERKQYRIIGVSIYTGAKIGENHAWHGEEMRERLEAEVLKLNAEGGPVAYSVEVQGANDWRRVGHDGITWVPIGELQEALEEIKDIKKERDEWKYKAEVNRVSHDTHLKNSAQAINDLRKERDAWRKEAERFCQVQNNLAASISELEIKLSRQRESKVKLIRENDRLHADLDAIRSEMGAARVTTSNYASMYRQQRFMRKALERNFEVTAAAKEYWKSEAQRLLEKQDGLDRAMRLVAVGIFNP